MAETENVTPLPRRLPATVTLAKGMALTPNEMRTLKEKTGRPLNDLLGGDTDDLDAAPDRIQSLVWVQLRRDGYHDVEWEAAGDVIPEFAETMPDPSSEEPSTDSSPSAASGA